MKTLYIIRHGQTTHNLEGIVQGSGIDSDLNHTGQMQAQAFYETYQHIPFDKIYTSNLKRTQQSVTQFVQKGIPTESHHGLNEINWGHKEGRKITPEEDVYYREMLEKWRKGHTHIAIEGGESPQDVANRQKEFLEVLMQRPEEQNVLIAMHGRALRIFLTLLLNYELKEMDLFEHTNLCLYQVNYTGSMFVITKHNDTQHLQKLKTHSTQKV